MPRSLPETPNIFRKQLRVPIPSAPPVRALLEAYCNAAAGATKWKQSESHGYLQYQYNHADTTIYVEIRPSLPQQAIVDSITLSQQEVHRLRDLDTDVFLAALAQFLNAPTDKEGYAWLTASQILEYRSIKPIMKQESGGSVIRRAGHRTTDLIDISNCFTHLADTWIVVQPSHQRSTSKRKKKETILEAPLLQIDKVLPQHSPRNNNSSRATVTPYQVAWHYCLGPWFHQKVNESKEKIAWLHQQVLHYDLHSKLWEKRIGIYLLLNPLLIDRGKTLLEIESFFNDLSLPIEQHHPDRTRRRFEQALEKLEEDHLVDGWTFALDNEELPLRHWLKTWLSWKVQITLAPHTLL